MSIGDLFVVIVLWAIDYECAYMDRHISREDSKQMNVVNHKPFRLELFQA